MADQNRLAFDKTSSSCSASPRKENPERSPTRQHSPYVFDSCLSSDRFGQLGRIRASSWDDSDDNQPPIPDMTGSKTCRIYTNDDKSPKKSVFSEINELKKEFFKAREQEREIEGMESVRAELETKLNFDRRQTPGRIRRRSRSSGSSSPVGTPGELETQTSPLRTNKSSGSETDYLPEMSPKTSPYDATYYLNNFFTELKSRRISMMDPISELEAIENEIGKMAPEEGDGIMCKTSRKLSQILEVEESRKDLGKSPKENPSNSDLFQKFFTKREENESSPLQMSGRSKKSEEPAENSEEKKDGRFKSHSTEYLRVFHKPHNKSQGSLSERTPKFFERGLDTDFIILSAKAAKTQLNTPETLDDKDDTTPVQLLSFTPDGPDKNFSEIQDAEKNAPESLTIDLRKIIAPEDTTPRKSTSRTNSGKSRKSYNESPKFMLNLDRDSARSLKVEDLNMLDSQKRDASEQCDVAENDPEEHSSPMPKAPCLESLISPRKSSKVQEEVSNRSKSKSQDKKKKRYSMDSDRSVKASGRHSQRISERTHKTSRTPKSPGRYSHESEDSPDSPFSKSSKTSKSPSKTPRSNAVSELNLELNVPEAPKLSHRSSKSVGTITRKKDRSGTKSSKHSDQHSLSSRSRRKEHTESRNSSPRKASLISGRSSFENQEEFLIEVKKLEDSLRAAFSEEYRSGHSRYSSTPVLKLTSRTGSSGSRKSSLENREELLNFEKASFENSSPRTAKLTSRTNRSRKSKDSLENREECVSPENIGVTSSRESGSPYPLKMIVRRKSRSPRKSKDGSGNGEEFVNLEHLRDSSSRESGKVGDTASNCSSGSSGSKSSCKEVEMTDQQHSHRSETNNPERVKAERQRLSRSRNSSRTSVGSTFTEMDSPVRSTTKSRPNSYTPKGPYETQEPISGRTNRSAAYEDEDTEDPEEINSTHRSSLGDESGRLSHKRLSVINEVSFEDIEASNYVENDRSGMEKASIDESASIEIARHEQDEWKELIDKFKSSPNTFVLENFPGFPRPKDISHNSMAEYSKNSACEYDEKMFLRSRLRERMTKDDERIERLEESVNLADRDSLLGKTRQDGFTFQIPQQIYHVNLEKSSPYGIGEFGDVPCWNAGVSAPKDLERPKEHGDGVPSKRIPEVLPPILEVKESEVRGQSRDDFRESTPLLFSEAQEDSDFAHVIACRVKASKSDNCINRKVSERQILPDSFPNRCNYKSDEMDVMESEENRKSYSGKYMSKSTINQNSSSESFGYEKEWENLVFEYERTPRLSRSLSNLDMRLQSQRDHYDTLSNSGSEVFKSPDTKKTSKKSTDMNKFLSSEAEKDKTKPSNWLKLRHTEPKNSYKSGKRVKTKFRKRGSPSPKDYLISSRKGQPLVPALKLRNPNCFQNFYKRFISVFCLTSSSSAATSK